MSKADIEGLVWAVRGDAQRQAGLSTLETPEMDIQAFVRAILAAIRDPADALCDVGAAWVEDDCSNNRTPQMRNAFNAIVDKMLDESE